MNNLQQFYPRDDDKLPDLSLEEIKNRCIKYVRNVRLGFPGYTGIMNLERLKNWLRLDCRLSEFPPDSLLEDWLGQWDYTNLSKWSYENDSRPEDN